jgi:hypothetical protein
MMYYVDMNVARLASIATLVRGFRPAPRGRPGLPAVGLRAIKSTGEIDFEQLDGILPSTPAPSPDEQIRPGDVLLASRGSLPKVGLAPATTAEGIYASTNIIAVRPNSESVLPAYLFAWMDHIIRDPNHVLLRRASTGQLTLRRAELERLAIPLPSRQRQEQIALAAEAIRRARDAHRQLADNAETILALFLSEVFE